MISRDDAKHLLRVLKENLSPVELERILTVVSRRLGGTIKDLVEDKPSELVRAILEELRSRIIFPCMMLLEIYDYMVERFGIERIELVLGPLENNKITLDPTIIEEIRRSTQEMVIFFNRAVEEIGLYNLKIEIGRYTPWWRP